MKTFILRVKPFFVLKGDLTTILLLGFGTLFRREDAESLFLCDNKEKKRKKKKKPKNPSQLHRLESRGIFYPQALQTLVSPPWKIQRTKSVVFNLGQTISLLRRSLKIIPLLFCGEKLRCSYLEVMLEPSLQLFLSVNFLKLKHLKFVAKKNTCVNVYSQLWISPWSHYYFSR